MLQSINDLHGYSILADDGEIGTVEDFYFDDFRWKIRYFVVETGNWLFGRRVLISPVFVGQADANARTIPVSLTREQVKSSPDIDTHKPVSRQHELELPPYLGWPAYGMLAQAMFPSAVISEVSSPTEPSQSNDPNLRSATEVRGYRVRSTDREVGKVKDFVFDDVSRDIHFIIVDMGNRVGTRLVLIAPQWIGGITWRERSVRVDLDSEAIRRIPEFHPVFPISDEYALRLHQHNGRTNPMGAGDSRKGGLPRSETKALYDRISKVYDVLSERSEEPVRQAALDLLAARPGETVLEIGFGTGHCLIALAKCVGLHGKVHGLDLSDGMLAEAKALIDRERMADRVEPRTGDAVALPYDDQVMDGVFLSFTLELFDYPEIRIVLQECRRVLKVGGRIVVAGMSERGPHGLIFEAYEWSHRHFPSFVDCRPILVRDAIEAAGFTIKASQTMQIWVPVEVVVGLK